MINTACKLNKILLAVVLTGALMVASKAVVSAAECEPTYGGGETCLINKRFEIIKEVRLCDSNGENCSDWEDKVTGVEEGDVVEFRVRIKNLSDEEADEFDNMKMKDVLPDEMYRIGGDGLTEYWDNFGDNETKTFKIKAMVDSDEYDVDGDFEKCVVNKASAYWDGNFEGADTATVCYGDQEPTELPETGASGTVAVIGSILVFLGFALKKSKSLVK